MKTIQSVSRYFPDQCGGIQIHLSDLIPALRTYGVQSTVAAAQAGSRESTYEYEGVEVHRYSIGAVPISEPNHGQLSPSSVERFAEWLIQQDADVYHQHHWTPDCGLPHLQAAKSLGMATVVTIHLPVPVCQRKTLMLEGRQACDGRIDLARCSRCCGVPAFLPAPALQVLSHLPMPLSQGVQRVLNRTDRFAVPLKTTMNAMLSPLAIPTFVAARRNRLMEMARLSDRIVAVSQWLYDTLRLNGVPEEKLVLYRCGVATGFQRSTAAPTTNPLRVGFIGRWNANKGLHVLLDALQLLPANAPIELVIHSIEDDELYRRQMMRRIAGDPRIRVASALSHQDLPAAVSNLSLLAVPSQWLETGPLVILEAHACGVPAVGSNLGGIAELIHHGVDGLLIPPNDAQAWAAMLLQLIENPDLLDRWRQGIRPVRAIETEAMQIAALYRDILSRSVAQSSEVASYC
ncbi:glycosyltransferase [Leptolyngbya sp. FACHB-36]|uniref:glycosyltransferase n=1 Tax=Leptolyngbya sp. FACHB-36 TaxID=2692808 RepID=UPI00168155E1|nr:glycosyltransferase [Leptolyngbya sp. FACHB-36]MBD2022191.1 glycosyltransferase [Leptolyngbya sp. FACHB-36]